jgi:glutathione peroxidase
MSQSLYEIPVRRIDGTETTLFDYAGSVLLIVNVASKCGQTPQYEGLEKLYARYRDRGFAVLGFPSNDFGEQEPGSNDEILDFCRSVYGVNFPMFSKIAVKGESQHPLYRRLTSAAPRIEFPSGSKARERLSEKGQLDRQPEILWNFEKFLVDRNGAVKARFGHEMKPDDPRIVDAIESELDVGRSVSRS